MIISLLGECIFKTMFITITKIRINELRLDSTIKIEDVVIDESPTITLCDLMCTYIERNKNAKLSFYFPKLSSQFISFDNPKVISDNGSVHYTGSYEFIYSPDLGNSWKPFIKCCNNCDEPLYSIKYKSVGVRHDGLGSQIVKFAITRTHDGRSSITSICVRMVVRDNNQSIVGVSQWIDLPFKRNTQYKKKKKSKK